MLADGPPESALVALRGPSPNFHPVVVVANSIIDQMQTLFFPLRVDGRAVLELVNGDSQCHPNLVCCISYTHSVGTGGCDWGCASWYQGYQGYHGASEGQGRIGC